MVCLFHCLFIYPLFDYVCLSTLLCEQGNLGLQGLKAQQPPLHHDVDPALAFTMDTTHAVAFMQAQGAVVATSAAPAKCSISTGDGSTTARSANRPSLL
jgi:hypothetical protein